MYSRSTHLVRAASRKARLMPQNSSWTAFTQCYELYRADQNKVLWMENSVQPRKPFWSMAGLHGLFFNLYFLPVNGDLLATECDEDSFQRERSESDLIKMGRHFMFDGRYSMLLLKDCSKEKRELRKISGNFLGWLLLVIQICEYRTKIWIWDIVVMKAHAFQDRAKPYDFTDLLYTFTKMKSFGSNIHKIWSDCKKNYDVYPSNSTSYSAIVAIWLLQIRRSKCFKLQDFPSTWIFDTHRAPQYCRTHPQQRRTAHGVTPTRIGWPRLDT